MNKLTKTVKSVIAGAAFAAAAMAATSANASDIILDEHWAYMNSWDKVLAFCSNVTCTSISASGRGYVVWYY